MSDYADRNQLSSQSTSSVGFTTSNSSMGSSGNSSQPIPISRAHSKRKDGDSSTAAFDVKKVPSQEQNHRNDGAPLVETTSSTRGHLPQPPSEGEEEDKSLHGRSDDDCDDEKFTPPQAAFSSTTPMSVQAVAPPPTSTSNSSGENGHTVAIVLRDGGNLGAKPYEHSVSGHHIMLAEKGKIWKSTRCHRETRFYKLLSQHYRPGEATTDEILERQISQVKDEDRREVSYDEALDVICDIDDSCKLLGPFVPKYYGTRQVRKLLVRNTDKDKRKQQSDHPSDSFPSSPPTNNSMGSHAQFDAAAHHTAQDIIEEFIAEQGPKTPPSTLQNADEQSSRDGDQIVDMIVLEDVCNQMVHPCVLDVKMGTRQYGVNPPSEKKASKHAKSLKSTSASLGLRLAGFKQWDHTKSSFACKSKSDCRSMTPLEVESAIFDFCQQNGQMCGKFCGIVGQIRAAFQQQKVFRFFTSSLLLVYDAANPMATARVAMVDFAYTYRISELVRAADEDAGQLTDVGYLVGLETLRAMLARNSVSQ